MEKLVLDFVLAFVPVFVSMDIIGVLPIYVGLTEGIEPQQRRKIVGESLITALLVAVGFIILGKSVFNLLSVTVNDFMVAGGALLFVIATFDLVSERKPTRRVPDIGAVPLGTPLIVGPGVLTTSLMLSVDFYHIVITIAAVVANIAVAGAVLMGADWMTRLIGRNGSRAVSKVANLLLGAIAVMMVRKGIIGIVTGMVISPVGH